MGVSGWTLHDLSAFQFCNISITLTHSTCQALPWLHCLALDTEKTAATLCAQSSCWQLVLPTAAELSLSACGAEARSTVSPQGQTGKHKRVNVQRLGQAHGRQSLGPENMGINIDKQQKSPEDCIIFKLHTVECYRKKTNHVSEERWKTLILSEQGEGTQHFKVVSDKIRAPSMHLATEWTEEGVKLAGSHHLEFLLFSPLGRQVIEAIAALLYQPFGFTQPVLHRFCAHFKVFHLDL